MSRKEIIHWQACGRGIAEQMIFDDVKPGEISQTTGLDIKKLIECKNKNDKYDHISFDLSTIEDDDILYIYYNWHRSGGYNTKISDVKGQFKIKINPPKGGVLCAFFSEVIILK
jgi:hypothetical protein